MYYSGMTRTAILGILLTFATRALAFGPFDSKPYLTPTDSAAYSMYVNWNSAAAESTIVVYGLTSDLSDTLRVPGIGYYHHARIGSLAPGTEYFYRVWPAGDLKKFKTFAAAADSFNFAVIGDTRSDSAAHQSVIERLAAYPSAFYLHLGDFVYYGDSAGQWRTFFNIEDTVFQDRPILPMIGNHETPSWPYDTLFALPGAGEYYSVDYANVHFVILNTSGDLYNAQRDWLRNDLIAAHNNPATDWIIVNFHRPPYSSGSHGSQVDVQEAWCPLFDSNRVDIVFAGHDHDYERTIPINGVTYIVSGGGGAPLGSVGSNPWTAYSESTHQFCLVKIKGLKLAMYSIRPDGSICDSLIMDRTGGIAERSGNTALEFNVIPNPFKNSITIEFSKGHGIEVIGIKIFDISGRLVKTFTLSDIPHQGSIIWPGIDDDGVSLPAAVYFLRLETAGAKTIEKIIKAE
jgi:hypothetical protein